MQAIRLPVCSDPKFQTECYHNVRLSIVLRDLTNERWLANHFVNLMLHADSFDQLPEIRFEDHLDIYDGLLYEHALYAEGREWSKAIREALLHEKYVVVFLDWGKVPQSVYFKKQSMIHEALVYGFDDMTGVFELLAFEADGQSYGKIMLSYKEIDEHLTAMLASNPQRMRRFSFYGYPIVQIGVRSNYPVGVNLRQVYYAIERGRVGGAAGQSHGCATGCYVNRYLSEYFASMARKEIPILSDIGLWEIWLHKMILHKKLMSDRLEIIDQETATTTKQLVGTYWTGSFRTMLTIRALTRKFAKTKERDLLGLMAEHFAKAYGMERRAATIMLDHLNHHRLSDQFESRKEDLEW